MAARKWTKLQREIQGRAIRRWKSWQSSTGPRSPQGKAISSRNSFKHGCDSIWVKKLRKMERDLRRSKSASVSATRELETYRQKVEQRISENALMSRNPKILLKAFGFLSAEISRTSKKIFMDLEFFKERPDGLGAFVRKFEWEMAALRANCSIQKKRKSERRFRWEYVEIPDNTLATTKNPSSA